MTNNLTPEQLKAIAEKIADYLFTNGIGQKAERLILEMPEGQMARGRNGGGWCRQAVIDAAYQILSEQLKGSTQ